jgi:hypothetical protein
MLKVVEECPRAERAASNMLDTPHLGIPYHMRGSKYTMEGKRESASCGKSSRQRNRPETPLLQLPCPQSSLIKKDRQEKEKLQLECHGILCHVGPGPPKKPNADQLKLLLKWQGLEVKRYKPENEAMWESFISDFDNWEALPNRVAERWTAQDERELEALDDYSTSL